MLVFLKRLQEEQFLNISVSEAFFSHSLPGTFVTLGIHLRKTPEGKGSHQV
jgi:hypothetical protein